MAVILQAIDFPYSRSVCARLQAVGYLRGYLALCQEPVVVSGFRRYDGLRNSTQGVRGPMSGTACFSTRPRTRRKIRTEIGTKNVQTLDTVLIRIWTAGRSNRESTRPRISTTGLQVFTLRRFREKVVPNCSTTVVIAGFADSFHQISVERFASRRMLLKCGCHLRGTAPYQDHRRENALCSQMQFKGILYEASLPVGQSAHRQRRVTLNLCLRLFDRVVDASEVYPLRSETRIQSRVDCRKDCTEPLDIREPPTQIQHRTCADSCSVNPSRDQKRTKCYDRTAVCSVGEKGLSGKNVHENAPTAEQLLNHWIPPEELGPSVSLQIYSE